MSMFCHELTEVKFSLNHLDACKQLTSITKTSLGPNGCNKLIINHIEKLFLTSDASTIVKEIEAQHPVAKVLVFASMRQMEDCRDAINLVLTLAWELLNQVETLIHMGIHPNYIVQGYHKSL